jgi:hypothetical protein
VPAEPDGPADQPAESAADATTDPSTHREPRTDTETETDSEIMTDDAAGASAGAVVASTPAPLHGVGDPGRGNGAGADPAAAASHEATAVDGDTEDGDTEATAAAADPPARTQAEAAVVPAAHLETEAASGVAGAAVDSAIDGAIDSASHSASHSAIDENIEDPEGGGVAEVRMLGTLTAHGPGPVEHDRVDLLTEIIVYLALYPDGVHPRVLAAAIWPRGVSDDVVEAAIERVGTWLGRDPTGQPRLVADADGRLCLGPDVRCDWALFTAYAHRSTLPTSDNEGDLTTALRMVTGPLWSDLPAGRYGWLAATPIERMTRAAVVDVAHRLATLALGFGDTLTAMAACRTGLRAVPAAEVLWRDLLRTVAARGDRRTLESVVGEMYRALPAGSGRRGPRAEPETDALVQELLPGYRRRR